MPFKLRIAGVSIVLAAIAGGGFAYLSHERAKERQLTAQNESLNGVVNQMQHQLEALRQQMADLSAEKAARTTPASAPSPKQPARRTVRTVVRPRVQRPVEDPRIRQMQAEIADQQQQIAGAREDLDKAKQELNGRLNSTRDELSTSIAKNHQELVELEKRGERSYYEFQLDKSKNFDRVGPLRLSLRKADVKHKSFNLAMMVDDDQLQKKNVNLYEPVRIDMDGESVELVVNGISKNHIQGYVSEPKYKKGEARDSLSTSARSQ